MSIHRVARDLAVLNELGKKRVKPIEHRAPAGRLLVVC
jgi:hypothetical protein